MEKGFYMCYMPGGGSPTHRHQTEKSAHIEAERLAKKFPGNKIFILRTILVVQEQTIFTQDCTPSDIDDLPF